MATIEDNLRAKVQAAEAELKHGRCQLIQYLSYKNGKFEMDPRYAPQAEELLQREKHLSASISSMEDAMQRAIELVKDIKGINRNQLLPELQARRRSLQSDITRCETEIAVIRKKGGAPSGCMAMIVGQAGAARLDDLGNRIKEHEQNLKQLRPELSKVDKLIHEIEALYHDAAPGI